MHEFAVHSTKQYYGALDSFLHINITLNSGAAYGMLSDKPEVATAIQGIFSFLVFFVTLIALNKLPYLAVGFFISFGGMFNFFDHLVPLTMAIDVFDYGPAGTMIEGVVVDYFQF
jgi:lipoprotein signal peptidase